jgi:hypothetical protein
MKSESRKIKLQAAIVIAALLLLAGAIIVIIIMLINDFQRRMITGDSMVQITRISIDYHGKAASLSSEKAGIKTSIDLDYPLDSFKPDLYLQVDSTDICAYQKDNDKFLLDKNGESTTPVKWEKLQFRGNKKIVISVWDKNLRIGQQQILPDKFLFDIVVSPTQTSGRYGDYSWKVDLEKIAL